MLCPKCKAKHKDSGPYRNHAAPNAQHSLKTIRHLTGENLDLCESCHGVFISRDSLRKIENEARNSRRIAQQEVLTALLRRAYHTEPSDEAFLCPKCGEEMIEREWGFGAQVLVDVCLDCAGVWLDAGELEALEAYFSVPF